MEGVYNVMASYTLKPGAYIICDPAYIISKNKEGFAFSEKIRIMFFKEMNKFHHFEIDGITLYMFRSLGGDGVFDGVGTDTGTIIIIETSQLKDDIRFKSSFNKGNIKTFETEEPIIACVENFDLTLSNGISIHTE